MSWIQNISRRDFLQDVFSAGALVLGAGLVPDNQLAAAVEDTPPDCGSFHPNVFLGLETDGTVYITAHRSEMGNGSRTALPRVVADEMDADWSRVKILQAYGDPRYGSQDTDASRSILGFFQTMRVAGATARLMLIRAAAAEWSVPVSECRSGIHAVVHTVGPPEIIRGTGAGGLEVTRPIETRIAVQGAGRPALHRQGCGSLRSSGDLHGEGDLRHGRSAGWHGLRIYRAAARSGRESQILRRSGGIEGAWGAPNHPHGTFQTSPWISAVRWCGGNCRQHLGSLPGPQKATYGLGAGSACRL